MLRVVQACGDLDHAASRHYVTLTFHFTAETENDVFMFPEIPQRVLSSVYLT